MKRCIVLADGRRLGLGDYVRAWRRCLTLPPETYIGRGISGWGQTAAEAIYDCRRGMDDRINRRIPGYGIGRKWDPDWQAQTWRLARELNTPRLIVRWIPTEWRRRFAHRLPD